MRRSGRRAAQPASQTGKDTVLAVRRQWAEPAAAGRVPLPVALHLTWRKQKLPAGRAAPLDLDGVSVGLARHWLEHPMLPPAAVVGRVGVDEVATAAGCKVGRRGSGPGGARLLLRRNPKWQADKGCSESVKSLAAPLCPA